ncbi:hypothetical protein MLD38_010071 [Melastoma candidum]|uniref:Uncharacterized protein n=1 Tax=Melastoma candidum TaxID=119954 RepID=A0ACB9R0F9_9MYRT|nr:hypothetical protein MLD38_010071 [Melastoma candidum]
MVAGKVKLAMRFHKSPKPPQHHHHSPSSHVQPKPPDIFEVLRLVDHLRDRESLLLTQLLQLKLSHQSSSLDSASKNAQLSSLSARLLDLQRHNDSLRKELADLKLAAEAAREESQRTISHLRAEIMKSASSSDSESGGLASSRRFGLHQNQNAGVGKWSVGEKAGEGAGVRKVTWPPGSETSSTEEVLITATLGRELPIRESHCTAPTPAAASSSSSPACNNQLAIKDGASSDHTSSSSTSSSPSSSPYGKERPPPPPPPPAPRGGMAAIMTVKRVPEVVEFYHSLMRRDTKKRHWQRRPNGARLCLCCGSHHGSARDMNRGNREPIKTDVETQGDFIRFLIKEVEGAAFSEIEDVVPFVKWLDDELLYLVDERAVLKHFDWPEQKADALREAAFGQALKKMQALLEKLEHGVYNLSRMRESAANRYKVFQIPTDWMLDNGIVSQIKLASVKLAMQYMKRVLAELELVGGGLEEEELIVQGVRFAFRVHQFAGGFDVETMKAFQELRDKARLYHAQCRTNNKDDQSASNLCFRGNAPPPPPPPPICSALLV